MLIEKLFSFALLSALAFGALTMASCSIEAGVVINGLYWARRNVDAPGTFAATPEHAGMFYQWNHKKGWPTKGSITDWASNNEPGDSWTAANDPCPLGWRVPTNVEFIQLLDEAKVVRFWTTQNGVDGMRFTDRASGRFIFLPAVSYRRFNDGSVDTVGHFGEYWSSSPNFSNDAWELGFDSNVASRESFPRSYGFSVRCVRDD